MDCGAPWQGSVKRDLSTLSGDKTLNEAIKLFT